MTRIDRIAWTLAALVAFGSCEKHATSTVERPVSPPAAAQTGTPVPAAPPAAVDTQTEAPAAARSPIQTVEELGRRMKNVSLLAPNAPELIRTEYANLVEPALLAKWIDAPGTAPGRMVSSPWPERIEVSHSTPVGSNEMRVDGTLVEVTSGGEAGRVPMRCVLVRDRGSWRIREYREEKTESGEPSSPVSSDAQIAVETIRSYYAAIAAHDYERAFAMWGGSGPPDQSPEAFAAGFADTAAVHVDTGTPSRVEGAAGSRYIDVPVVVTARTTTGHLQRFTGTYTLRRSVVDGASAAQRRWHIDRATLREKG